MIKERGHNGQWVITWVWSDRKGKGSAVEVPLPLGQKPTSAAINRSREIAMSKGYPGHKGGKINYLISDAAAWVARHWPFG